MSPRSDDWSYEPLYKTTYLKDLLEKRRITDDIKKSLNEAFKQMSKKLGKKNAILAIFLFGSIIEVIYDQERIRDNSKVFYFGLANEYTKLRLAEREFADSILGLAMNGCSG